MAEFTRRNVLPAGLRQVPPPLLRSPSRARCRPAGRQAGRRLLSLQGRRVRITSINDGARTFPMPDGFVRNVPKDQALAAAEAAYMPKGMVTVPFNPQWSTPARSWC